MSAKTTPLVWFITGASSGFGLLLSLHALRSGHQVIGTVRDRQRSADAVSQIESAGGKCVVLDLAKPRSISETVANVLSDGGKVDVLVNNAGYSLLGAVEDMSEEETRAQMETNFFGPLFLMQALIPSMRERRSGTIVNISSTAAVSALPCCGLYSASKFALEGISESLSHELEPFNVRVLIVEPGAFRTNFLHAFVRTAKPLTPAYVGGPVADMLDKFDQYRGKQPGDPEKGVRGIFEAVIGGGGGDGGGLRLLLGRDAVGRMEGKIRSLQGDLERTRGRAEEMDVD
ncbi:NAD(P)-binding protein [Saccharata proteae CBS 121410]|uniref:NAD(P)-binding protein n=1 Tax=Saccharata proteae CBS 121410 TaxID=1314787 RepID=A0A9P4LXE7_9PEZI|nr:NAD(P)-binding protein [Saccharata proteae CBS 121410]